MGNALRQSAKKKSGTSGTLEPNTEQQNKPRLPSKLNVLLIGETGSGKTSIAHRLAYDQFPYRMEADSENRHEMSETFQGEQVTVILWDNTDQEKFRSLTSSYYRMAHIVFVVYSIASRSSWQEVRGWITEAERYSPDAVVCILGNKNDLKSDRMVTTAEATEFGETSGKYFIEVSAKTGEHLKEVLAEMIKQFSQTQA